MANYPYYNYPPQMYPPQPTPMITPMAQAPQPSQNGIIWVANINEAMGFPVVPNAAVALWDSNSPCIYVKQADQTGKPTMKIYDLVERTPAPASQKTETQMPDYITRQEFEKLAAKVDGMIPAKKAKKEDAE